MYVCTYVLFEHKMCNMFEHYAQVWFEISRVHTLYLHKTSYRWLTITLTHVHQPILTILAELSESKTVEKYFIFHLT